MLFADLADEASRDFLQGVALAGGVTEVPLLAAPMDRTTHVLEVYSPDSSEPLRLLADPVGPPTSEGFPLRLRSTEEESKPQLKAEKKSDRDRPATMKARHVTSHDLTDRHTADLEGAAPAEKRPSEVIGRELANGKLRIESFIGGGGVGAVYKAHHRDLRIPVAVKVLHDNFQADADFGRRFHAEALAASRLDHPNITRVLDFGQEPDGLLYLVMEYLDGVGLRSVLEKEKRLSLERIVKLTSQVCAGLAHAHARNIVHKDIKPENLVIIPGHDDDGNAMEIVKVCDFGIAQGAVHEETRRFQGTPEYMSPEQCTSSELDARSDIYSLGIVVYELATGDVPFIDDDLRHLLWLQINEPPPPPTKRFPGVDPRLERIILRAIAKEKDARYASMRDLRAHLRDLLDKPVAALSGRWRGPSLDEAAQIIAARKAAAPSPPPPSSGSDWIQRGGEITLELASGPNVSPRTELTVDPAAFMRKLVSTTDARQFAELAAPLEPAIPEMAHAQQIEALWRLACTLDILATEGPELPGSRAAMSKALLRVIHDPGNLAPVAQRVLTVGRRRRRATPHVGGRVRRARALLRSRSPEQRSGGAPALREGASRHRRGGDAGASRRPRAPGRSPHHAERDQRRRGAPHRHPAVSRRADRRSRRVVCALEQSAPRSRGGRCAAARFWRERARLARPRA